jgi:hypothetical protein
VRCPRRPGPPASARDAGADQQSPRSTRSSRATVLIFDISREKDLQVDPADLETIARIVPGATVHRVPDLTHTLRRQPGPPSMGAYRGELRRPVEPEVPATVVSWCRQATRIVPPTA